MLEYASTTQNVELQSVVSRCMSCLQIVIVAWQERTSRYIARLGKELVEMLFSTKKDPTADLVDFSLLKWRHRDLLEMTLKSWDCSAPCDRECPLHKYMLQPLL